jgi:histone H3/H4
MRVGLCVSQESVAITAKAVEFFVGQLAEKAGKEAVDSGRKTIKVEDILKVVEQNQIKYEFLNDAFSSVPPKR